MSMRCVDEMRVVRVEKARKKREVDYTTWRKTTTRVVQKKQIKKNLTLSWIGKRKEKKL